MGRVRYGRMVRLTPLKRGLILHVCGLLLVVASAGAIGWLACQPAASAALMLLPGLGIGAGAFLVALGLRNASHAIVEAARASLREEFHLALEIRRPDLDDQTRRDLFERYQGICPHLRDAFRESAQRRRRDALAAATRGPLVLEVGCADGGITHYLREQGHDCVGVDLSFRQVRGANGGGYVQADALRLPFGAGTFDTVLLPEILEHLHAPATALAEAARVCRDRVVLSVPLTKILDPTHLHHFDRQAIRDLVDRVPELTVAEETEVATFLVVTCRRQGR
jgi:hypothetical protein